MNKPVPAPKAVVALIAAAIALEEVILATVVPPDGKPGPESNVLVPAMMLPVVANWAGVNGLVIEVIAALAFVLVPVKTIVCCNQVAGCGVLPASAGLSKIAIPRIRGINYGTPTSFAFKGTVWPA